MNSKVAALRIARQLTKCEQGADRLLADTASLVAEMAIARVESEAATGTGQRAMQRVIDAQRAVSNAQAGLIRAHADLLRIGQERGDIPDTNCPPPQGVLSVAA
jgi:hypothetical protein